MGNAELHQEKEQITLKDIGFTEKGLVYHELFVVKFLEEHSIVRQGKKYYKFNDFYWEELDEEELVDLLKSFLDGVEKFLWKPNYENDLIHFITRLTKKVEAMDSERYIMPFKDFDFNFRKGVAEEKDKNRYFTFCKDYTFDEINSAKCLKFNQFMDEISQNDEDFKKYLLQLFGLILSGENRLNLVTIVFGEGANSKSLIIKLLSQLVGMKFVASRKIETFTENFGLDGLETAKLVTCGESETLKPVRFETIKSITGNDVVEITGKYKDIKSKALSLNMIFSTNRLFKILDDSDGIRRRLHVIELKYQVPVEKRDTELFEKLMSEEAGIINLILTNYVELIDTNGKLKFEMCQNVKSFTDKYFETYLVGSERSSFEKAEQVLKYIESYFDIGTQTDRIDKGMFHDVYCREIEDVSVELFWKIATPALNKKGVVIKKNGKRFLEGIRPKEEFSNLFNVNSLVNSVMFRRQPTVVTHSQDEESYC